MPPSFFRQRIAFVKKSRPLLLVDEVSIPNPVVESSSFNTLSVGVFAVSPPSFLRK